MSTSCPATIREICLSQNAMYNIHRLAVEELIREAVQGAARAEIVGPSGWIKAPPQKTNKRFLVNTLRHAVSNNKYHSSRNQNPNHKSTKYERKPEPTIKKEKPRRKH